MRCASVVRAGELGFRAELHASGEVFRRTQVVDLGREYGIGDGRPPSPTEMTLLDARLSAAVFTAGHRVMVLDIEALSVAAGHLAAFLVGVAAWTGPKLVLEQWLLADPAAEAALLEGVGAAVRGSLLLTYNGRAFDMRVLGSRCVANGIHPSCVEPRFHVDLLAPARRRFRGSVGGCSLQQLEREVLSFHREADVPGAEGPARYLAWLRGASPDVLSGAIEHNRLDVCSTAALATRLVSEWRLVAQQKAGELDPGLPALPWQRSAR